LAVATSLIAEGAVDDQPEAPPREGLRAFVRLHDARLDLSGMLVFMRGVRDLVASPLVPMAARWAGLSALLLVAGVGGCGSPDGAAGAPSQASSGVASTVPADAKASASSGSAKKSATATSLPPLIEREDIPLGKPCRFRVARPDPTDTLPAPSPDAEWRARKGQRFVTCHFRVRAGLPTVDVLVETSPGENGIDALTFGSSDGAIRSERYGGGLTLYNAAEWELETDDVDGDGVVDFKLFWAHGTMGCTYYAFFIFSPDGGSPTKGSYVLANGKELCNPEIDRKRRVVMAFDVDRGVDVTLRWDGHAFVPLPKRGAP